ncbi:MAG: amidohydrolase family protein [Haliscomenobacter sp.]|nr:amidohydrolase family protein [Haliscomenobacter sp.]
MLDHIGKPDIRRGMSAQWKEGFNASPASACLLQTFRISHRSGMEFLARGRFFLTFVTVYEGLRPDRLMIGSDWPVCLLAAPGYAQTVEIDEAFLAPTPETQTNILGENARRFYDL